MTYVVLLCTASLRQRQRLRRHHYL